ncbi:neuroglobin-like isoform X2 [Ambystoma mexicanum]
MGGCALSGPGVSSDKTVPDSIGPEATSESIPEGGGPNTTQPAPLCISSTQKDLIESSWKVLHEDIARVGIIMFIRLFETHPECKDVFFLFRDIDDLQQLKMSKELQAHGLRVMSFIEKSVARLGQEDKLEMLAFELGRSHYRYNAPPKYYEYVGVQFIRAVKPILKERWTSEVQDAWESLFLYLTAMMKRGYYEEERQSGVNQTTYQQRSESPLAGNAQNSN